MHEVLGSERDINLTKASRYLRQYLHQVLSWFSCSSHASSAEKAWEKLSQAAVHGAVYDSRERLPHPKCLKDTRTTLLKHIYGFLDNPEKSQLVWLHGTAGVGKSAVAFTVAERMRGLKASEVTKVEKRLAGTFFFSRTNTNRCTTGYLFATLAYQLASNFSCVRSDVSKAIIEKPAVLESNSSVREQMEVLFLRPLRKLCQRQQGCPPLSFVIDALDECTSKAELVELITLLGQALREPDLPKLHILLTSRLEAHVRRAMEDEEVHQLVCEIPVKTSGDGVPDIISLDGADVDNDIYVFFNHSFASLRDHHRDFPQPTRDQLVKLATRAGRRFIVASTMMKFIDDGHNDPRGRLQIMLDLTSQLLPGTEVYRLYDRILSTCADPNRAYMHLSVVATLADPLPASQISKLLGPGEGNDVETTLVQLRSIMDIPTDSSLPVNIYHSSVRDYVSNPSNCSLPNLQPIAPHSILAYSSLRLMIEEIPASTALLDGLVELKRHSEVIPSEDPQNLRESLKFIVQPLEPLQVLSDLLWVRGDHAPVLRCWLETRDGRAWLQTEDGFDWLQTEVEADHDLDGNGENWLWPNGDGIDWLQTQSGRDWLQTHAARAWLRTLDGEDWLQTENVRDWLQTQSGRDWLQTQAARDWLQTRGGEDWLQTESGKDWLQTPHAEAWPFMGVWVTIVEFWSTLEAVSQYPIVPDFPCLPALQVIQHLKSLPDFLTFPVFLALRHPNNSTLVSSQDHLPDMEIIRAMKTFVNCANDVRERSQSASHALKYACHNWAIHLARVPRPWDARLYHVFDFFWNHNLLCWLEMHWCSKGLRACLAILYEGEKLAGDINDFVIARGRYFTHILSFQFPDERRKCSTSKCIK
ncbi:hypothetical protein DEU56DRAFT_901431 [Suillus clintonianus]|uniref:uncharacterized protein n=1 Tax=Suillus clintonianus TaxID=1904413 RepID=UPI001B864EEB|nr:uncharacterized protein DEU56DRAFT_901431 [Suillus clintonianus]KAG2137517.1 hypothetical protein DEU56DRAFT_901431 [Suillus clintonianus]